jgi:hypothetical protein
MCAYGAHESRSSPQPYDILRAMDTVPSIGPFRSSVALHPMSQSPGEDIVGSRRHELDGLSLLMIEEGTNLALTISLPTSIASAAAYN